MDFLKGISHKNFPPQKLKGHNFVEFFKWLSSSFKLIASSKEGANVDITPKEGENPFFIKV